MIPDRPGWYWYRTRDYWDGGGARGARKIIILQVKRYKDGLVVNLPWARFGRHAPFEYVGGFCGEWLGRVKRRSPQ